MSKKKIGFIGPHTAGFTDDRIRVELDSLSKQYGGLSATILRAEDGTRLRDNFDLPYSALIPTMLMAGATITGSWAEGPSGECSCYFIVCLDAEDPVDHFLARLRHQRPFRGSLKTT